MNKIIVLQGIPASGKSTWTKEFIKEHPNYIIINKDSLRLMKGKYWYPEHELLISRWEYLLVETTLKEDFNIIIDGTNLNKDLLTIWNNLATKYKYELEVKTFKISLEEAILRDSKRENPIGKEVIINFYNKYNNIIK